MADFSFKQGDDKKITVSLTENNVPISLSTAINVKGVLYVGNTYVKTYSLNVASDSGKLTTDLTGSANSLSIYVERSDSKLFPLGQIKLVVLIALTNAAFADGNEIKSMEFTLGSVQKGLGLDVTMP